MVNITSTMFVSTKDYVYEDVSLNKIAKNIKGYFALTYNTKSEIYSFVPIENIMINTYQGVIHKLIFENCVGIRYELHVKPNCGFITKRGLMSASKINKLDVFIDKDNLQCKLISESVYEGELDMVSVSVRYTYNYFCNGILIKGKI